VFENSVLRKIFGPKRDEVTGEWRRLQNEELYDTYLPNIQVIKSGILVGHVARRKRREVYAWFWWATLREGDHLEDLSVGGG
jgi:hypothetical protein